MKLRTLTITAVTALLLTGVASVRADDKDTSGKASFESRSEKTSDKKFAEEAAKGGLAEVKMGELAQQKGESSSVKQFGEKLVKDHQQANEKLKTICQQKSITVPTEIETKHQKMLDHLSSLSGAEFDKAFIEHAVNDHKKDVKKFETEANSGEDPAIRSFARETLPTLQAHLKIAQQLKDNPTASIPELNEPAGAETGSKDSQQQQDQQNQDQEKQNKQDTQTTQP
jgi:putative membrane protein